MRNFGKQLLTHEQIALAVVLLIGALLRTMALSRNSLWLDEMTSLQIAAQPVSDIIAGKGFDRHTPPFYYLLLHYWFSIAPFSTVGLRALSVALDIVNILLIYRIFSFQFKQSIGFLTATLFASSAYAIYFAQEGRMYPLLLCMVLLTYYSALHLLNTPEKRGYSLVLLISSILGLYTHYYYAVFLAGLGIAMLLKSKHGRLSWILPLVIAGVCFSPWLKVIASLSQGTGQRFREHLFSILPYSFFRFVSGYGVFPINFEDKVNINQTVFTNLDLILAYCIPFGALVALGMGILLKKYKSESTLFLFALLFTPIVATLISLKVPMLSERYLITIFPFVLCLVAITLIEIRWVWLRTPLFVLCFGLWVFASVQNFTNPKSGFAQWREAAELIQSQSDSATVVLVNPHYTSELMKYYLSSNYRIIPVPDKAPQQVEVPNEFWLVEPATATSVTSYIEKLGLRKTQELFFPLETGIRVYYFTD